MPNKEFTELKCMLAKIEEHQEHLHEMQHRILEVSLLILDVTQHPSNDDKARIAKMTADLKSVAKGLNKAVDTNPLPPA